VGVDPLRETAQRSLMQALAAGGNYGAALLVYRELRQRLHREINAEPDPETQAAFQQLRTAGREQAAGRQSRSGKLSPEAPGPDPPVPLLWAPLTRFVGRQAELAEIRHRVDAALQGTGATFFLAGEPGIGKTRLATEAANYAHRHGFQVLIGRCEEAGAAPYQPFVEAVREYLSSLTKVMRQAC
jgi:hypothetical protein